MENSINCALHILYTINEKTQGFVLLSGQKWKIIVVPSLSTIAGWAGRQHQTTIKISYYNLELGCYGD